MDSTAYCISLFWIDVWRHLRKIATQNTEKKKGRRRVVNQAKNPYRKLGRFFLAKPADPPSHRGGRTAALAWALNWRSAFFSKAGPCFAGDVVSLGPYFRAVCGFLSKFCFFVLKKMGFLKTLLVSLVI